MYSSVFFLKHLIFSLLLLFPFATADDTDSLAVCAALYSKYPHNVAYDPLRLQAVQTLANDTLWQSTNTNYWNLGNSRNRAICTFFPGSADEVSYVVKALNNHTSVQYALKSGGHNPNFGFSSVGGGVLISFRPNLADTTVSPDRSVASVGPGSRWQEALQTLDPYGKAIVGGRLGSVGVGGYTLGGGLSFLSSQYGLACDNVVNYQVVLADGTITDINSTSNTDLFYALKGGGNQFAIVTRFDFQTQNIGRVWGGTKTYAGAHHQDVISATTNFTANFHDPKAAVIVTFDNTIDTLVDIIVMFYFYDGPTPPAGIFDEFNAIPSLQSNIKIQSYPDLLIANDQYSILDTFRYQIRGATFPNMPYRKNVDFLNYHYDTFKKYSLTQQLHQLDVQVFSWSIQPIPTAIPAASNANGGNRLGLAPEHGDLIWMEYDLSWLNALCDQHCPGVIETIANQLVQYQATNYAGVTPTHYQSGDVDFVSHNPVFMNDAMYDQQPLQSYGSATYQKLKQIQQQRDPIGFFSKRQKGFTFST